MKVPYIFVIIYWYGVLAQLVERYTGSVEVSGSNPLCSTKRELSEHHYYRTVGSGSFFVEYLKKQALRL